MKTRLLIILGSIIAVTFGILLAYSVTSNNFDNETWGEKRSLIMSSHGLHNLNPTERDEFITKYTDMLNGEFHDHAYIIDLQHEYAVGEPIIFTVATWGYGHPCQSPSFTYYYETKNSTNIVFEDEFRRLCQVLDESDYTNYYQELDSNRTDKALNDDVFPVFDKPGSYIVSIDDKAEYEFQIKQFPDDVTQEELEMIQQILKKCADPNKDKLSYELGFAFRNQTHYIDNNTCEWESFVYPSPAHLESENSTHVGLDYEN